MIILLVNLASHLLLDKYKLKHPNKSLLREMSISLRLSHKNIQGLTWLLYLFRKRRGDLVIHNS